MRPQRIPCGSTQRGRLRPSTRATSTGALPFPSTCEASNVFGRRRSSSTEAEAAPEVEKVGGKGRPTPSRKEAEAARKARMTPPKTRRAKSAQGREQVREQRAKAREAMNTGEEKYLPMRDKGQVKRYIRNWVDAHRTIGEFMLPLFFIVFLSLFFIPAMYQFGTYAWIVIILAMTVDSIRVSRAVKAGVRERFGEDETKGITWYALTRAWQMRRLRLPKPQVKPGDPI